MKGIPLVALVGLLSSCTSSKSDVGNACLPAGAKNDLVHAQLKGYIDGFFANAEQLKSKQRRTELFEQYVQEQGFTVQGAKVIEVYAAAYMGALVRVGKVCKRGQGVLFDTTGISFEEYSKHWSEELRAIDSNSDGKIYADELNGFLERLPEPVKECAEK